MPILPKGNPQWSFPPDCSQALAASVKNQLNSMLDFGSVSVMSQSIGSVVQNLKPPTLVYSWDVDGVSVTDLPLALKS